MWDAFVTGRYQTLSTQQTAPGRTVIFPKEVMRAHRARGVKTRTEECEGRRRSRRGRE